jgi:hypothetical protein
MPRGIVIRIGGKKPKPGKPKGIVIRTGGVKPKLN